MNQNLKYEIETKLKELKDDNSTHGIRSKIASLAEFIEGALGEEESGFIFNLIGNSKEQWEAKKDIILSRLSGRLHSADWALPLTLVKSAAVASTENVTALAKNKVFVVHGHDEAARESVARFLEKLGLNPIILHEQANQSLTVIEKLERHSDVLFAVVLMTPDDVGGKFSDPPTLAKRARQNVLIELGYFVGKLGRSNVCSLRVGDTEIPSDFSGVIYTDMDKAGAWRTKLAQELVSAKFTIDLSALIA